MPGMLPVNLAANRHLYLGQVDGVPKYATAHLTLALQGYPLFGRAGIDLLEPSPRCARHTDPEVPRSMIEEVLRYDLTALGPTEVAVVVEAEALGGAPELLDRLGEQGVRRAAKLNEVGPPVLGEVGEGCLARRGQMRRTERQSHEGTPRERGGPAQLLRQGTGRRPSRMSLSSS